MDSLTAHGLQTFKMAVGTKFQLYNSLFTSLPFHRIEKTGVLLSLFLYHCEEGYNKQWSPLQIVESFFAQYTSLHEPKDQADLLFRFVQYAERQVVLFDAVEDAAFEDVHQFATRPTVQQWATRAAQEGKEEALEQWLQTFAVSLVLTAHPTQFYPGAVLGIIHDLATALKENDAFAINTYLQQLGKTPLLNKQKPTPYDEAVSLIWYLENVFYEAVGRVLASLTDALPAVDLGRNSVVRMGFWPGGDRDGNPNVLASTTLQVAAALHQSIVKCYCRDVRRLKRRLTFKGVAGIVADLEAKLYAYSFLQQRESPLHPDDILQPLQAIREILVQEHNGLFLPLLQDLINKVQAFGVHFATLDIRQESSVHTQVMEAVALNVPAFGAYPQLDEAGKMEAIANISFTADPSAFEGLVQDSLLSVDALRQIQNTNGEAGCHRYIISQCQRAVNVLEVYALFLLRGWSADEVKVDIVPLFETVEDLKNAAGVMKALYQNPLYAAHLQRRGRRQVIMVGFSDGTKDGGYLMANWSIYKAKAELTAIAREHNIRVLFFDGRGGPPARGGGKTHRFYASMGRRISTDEIQLTVQGQTVSSNFGNIPAAQYNIEQLLNAGIANNVFSEADKLLTAPQTEAVQRLADISYAAYAQLKEHPQFLDYLSEVSPLKYFSDTNISSRPSKRGAARRLSLKDLRAIPFVGAWSQMKQNVPGYYGLGTALETMEREGGFAQIKQIYDQSAYFRTLVDNCEMAMKKSYFPLTAYLAADPRYGELWTLVAGEYSRTQRYLLALSGKTELMENYPVDQLSIQMRERIVLPLTTIQQYALIRLRTEADEGGEKEALEKLVVRTSFGIINAGRNSV